MKLRNLCAIGLVVIGAVFTTIPFIYQKKCCTTNHENPRHPFTTKILKEELFRLFKGLEIKTFIDIPCGEVSWIDEIKPFIQEYVGIDLEEKIVQKNREKYGTNSVHFQNLILSKDLLPTADLIFCHDALNTLSQNEILATLLLFKKSGAKYIVLTAHPNIEKNGKGKDGFYRPIHWQLPPYNLPKPLLVLNDPTHENKKLALWRIEDLCASSY